MKKYLTALLVVFPLPVIIYTYAAHEPAQENEFKWKKLDQGLYLGDYHSPNRSQTGNSIITILKIDPAYYSFHLVEFGKPY